VHHTTVSPPNG
jgi:hypothetical protein